MAWLGFAGGGRGESWGRANEAWEKDGVVKKGGGGKVKRAKEKHQLTNCTKFPPSPRPHTSSALLASPSIPTVTRPPTNCLRSVVVFPASSSARTPRSAFSASVNGPSAAAPRASRRQASGVSSAGSVTKRVVRIRSAPRARTRVCRVAANRVFWRTGAASGM